MTVSLEAIFRSQTASRDKFLSRVMGIFSESIVLTWVLSPQSAYTNLGRPRITLPESKKSYSLDFMLQPRGEEKSFIAEMKCELEYQNYRFLTLEDAQQIEHHKGEAFLAFLEAARYPERCQVIVNRGRARKIQGAILVWGHVTPRGRAETMQRYGLIDVLSLQNIIGDLLKWRDQSYQDFLADRMTWCSELFHGLGLEQDRIPRSPGA